MPKNMALKERKKDKPYEIWARADGWAWYVLKKWQTDDRKPYARWMCAVTSPHIAPDFDYGDVYVQEIKDYASLVYRDPEYAQATGLLAIDLRQDEEWKEMNL